VIPVRLGGRNIVRQEDPMPIRRIAIVSTPVGPLGGGIGGGVELTLHSLVLGLSALGHQVDVVAPAGSLLVGARTHQIRGALQPSSQNEARDAPTVIPPGSVLGAMWDFVRARQADFDVVINLAFDWLPMYLSPFLDLPVAHIVSMASLNDAVDHALARLLIDRPGSAAVHSRAQAATFPGIAGRLRVIGNGIAVERYDLRAHADEPGHLGYVGRISPEKGLDDIVAAAGLSGLPVRAWGLMQDRGCWDAALAAHPDAQVTYEGFLPTDRLQAAIGGCRALLMTPKWVEAFGNVAIEAMACGVPVIAYDRGGPAEIVVDGETGFVVEPDSVAAVVAAIGRVGELDRAACRRRVEDHYSVAALARRMEAWLEELLSDQHLVAADASRSRRTMR
jgi:UDP-glucose:tetrahydrobiopterin glucosyltransferase